MNARPGALNAGVTQRTALSVNLNVIAQVRNRRDLPIPSVTRAASVVLAAGAQGITVHPRPDQRHIRSTDVHDLAALMQDWPDAELNIEGNPLHNLMDILQALADRGTLPQQCTFVPDAASQATSDHGWRLPEDAERLRPLIARARALGVRVSLFMDPEPGPIAMARALGADRVELYTEHYARSHGRQDQAVALGHHVAAATAALAAGLGVNAGHDLNLDNLPDFLAAVPGVQEVSIGHALIADALFMGLEAAVRAYLARVRR